MRTALLFTILLISSHSASAQINSPTSPTISPSAFETFKGDARRGPALIPTPTRTTGATAPTANADCTHLWDKATHMTKREWATTCRRIHGRIDTLKSIPMRTVEVVSPGTSKPARPNLTPASPVTHKVAIQVNQNDKAVMDLALNNAKNVVDFYKAKREAVAVEIVTYGPGLHMLRSDTSPVKDRIGSMSLENSNISFIACGNTQANQAKAEGKPVTLISEAKVMPSGVVRLMELQKQGYAYIRP